MPGHPEPLGPGVIVLLGCVVVGGSVVVAAVEVGGMVVGAGPDLGTGRALSGGGDPTTGGSLRTERSPVVGATSVCLVVVVRRTVETLVDSGSAGNSGGYAVVFESADDELTGMGGPSGRAAVCRLPSATAATVANPVAIAIPVAAHTTSRCGRASGSS
jgi:hypothetical protein